MAALDLGFSVSNFKMFSNGKEVIQYLGKLLIETNFNSDANSHFPLQPVALVLLDINMPIMDGLETLKKIKEQYKAFDESILMRPMVCYLSQLNY